MKALIIGGGKVGYYLLKTLQEKGYKTVVIERDKKLCSKIAEEPNVEVVCGDGTDIDVLKDSGIEDSQVVAAVTGKDEENFVICQIVKINFKSSEVIARINNPKNRAVFKAIGVRKTVCSTEVIANLIESELDDNRIKVIQALERGRMILLETVVDRSATWCNKDISSLKLPEGCIIVSILRNDAAIAPKGDIVIKDGDKVFIVTSMDKRNALEKNLIGE
ncbi:NAD-binding protein [Clostridium sp. OS1-26]|uniref:potassium channel family protein n=1 Tax=Clostridium sp. OS1-26 TaxID=3070681 RepID=UPI0027DED40F|nr:NAD-binding protein [Clostridium sp. OS1-26]WML36421.1 NAD-binding protein [Clostridium sp. OS1-26]